MDFSNHTEGLLNRAYWRAREGGFAEVHFNKANQNITLVRDPMGLEPLYYYLHNGHFDFASTLPDLLAKLPTKPNFNHEQLISLIEKNQTYSDETYYQHIYRAEPGVITTISAHTNVSKKPFWQLDADADDHLLANDAAYLEQFSALMHESLSVCVKGKHDQLCGKMSGGLDSGAIFTTAYQQGIRYPLFMQTALDDGVLVDDKKTALCLLAHFGHTDITYVTPDQFDPISSFQYCAQQFAGPAPYLVYMYMMHLYKAITQSGRRIVLSGAGGDDCVSAHAPAHTYLKSALEQKGYKQLWYEISQLRRNDHTSVRLLRRMATLIKVSHPAAYYYFGQSTGIDWLVKRFIKRQVSHQNRHKIKRIKTVREQEYDSLQGLQSYGLRMRVEYNAVLAKSMDFEFRYPLLNPKLLEFCFYLPINQKRRGTMGRYLMRQYLKKMGAPSQLYLQDQKQGGIIPGVLEKCYRWLESGQFTHHFSKLPYMQYADLSTIHKELIAKTAMYMLKHSQL
ncbi:MAG: asparagine synthase-related protein [Coxiellaceae bacterium]|nr:asparagine synthase-related protein [Coxiellaceae bacterium]